MPWHWVKIDAGEIVPENPRAFSGLAFMGGPMSVNDDLPWIASVLQSIRDAVRDDVPVIGHCLGGLLMSKALGGVVTRHTVKEIVLIGQQVPSVQSPVQMRDDVAGKCARLHDVADRLYSEWCKGLVR